VARVRWTTPALRDLRATLDWFDEHTTLVSGSRVARDIAGAADRAAQRPGGFAWVGSIYPQLGEVPRDVRRVLTRARRHVVYDHYDAGTDEVAILRVRGARQLPPTPEELGADT
jgi:plasmid stabilization system protein ParE